MFRSLMTIIRELYLYITKVIFILKYSVKSRRYINLVMWQHVAERHVFCVQCTQHTPVTTREILAAKCGTVWARKFR